MNGRQLAAEVGVSTATLHNWVRFGYLKPEQYGWAKHHDHSYSPTEIAIAYRIAKLTKAGFNPSSAHAIARGLPDTVALVAEMLDNPPAAPFEPAAGDAVEQAIADAMDTAMAVRDEDPSVVWRRLETCAVSDLHRLVSMVVTLAAMVPVEAPMSELLAWTEALNPDQEVA